MNPPNQGSPSQDVVRAFYERLGLRGRIALIVGAAASVALVWWLATFLWAIMLPAMSTDSTQADEQRRLAELEEKFAQQIAQFNGRTLFYVPAPPQDEPKDQDAEPTDEGPPPPPATYGGPSIIATINDVLWFSDGTRVKVGDTSGDIKVVSLRAPWEATLEWKGKEFRVPFFERDGVVLAKNSSEPASSNSPAPSSESPPQATPQADPAAPASEPSSAKEPAAPPAADPVPPPADADTTPPPPPADGQGEGPPPEPSADPSPVEPKPPAREGTR